MPDWLQAALSGLFAGAALMIGAGVAWFFRVPLGAVAAVMAFGSGVLISALAFELVQDANERGGLPPTIGGFLAGAVSYVVADAVLERRGAGERQRPDRGGDGAAPSGLAIAAGAVVDGVPESIVLGVGLATGTGIDVAVLAAVVISNLPEGLSSTSGLKSEGRSLAYVAGMWGAIAVVCGLSSLLGYAALQDAPDGVIAFVTAIAAGGILAMLANTMIPEAFAREKVLTGLFAAAGFLAAFALHDVS